VYNQSRGKNKGGEGGDTGRSVKQLKNTRSRGPPMPYEKGKREKKISRKVEHARGPWGKTEKKTARVSKRSFSHNTDKKFLYKGMGEKGRKQAGGQMKLNERPAPGNC